MARRWGKRTKPLTNDGRRLRRLRWRGVVEQTFIRVKSFRRFDGSAAIARAFIARGRW